MASVLVCYVTGEGQTANVADRIASEFTDRGHESAVVDIEDPPTDFAVADFAGVLDGRSIHVGKHRPAVLSFVADNREAIAPRRSGLFQVSPFSVTDDPERWAQVAGYVEEFVQGRLGVAPPAVGETTHES